LAKCLLSSGQINQDFLAARTHGFAESRQHIEAVDWDLLTGEFGIPRSQIERAAALLAPGHGTVAFWAMGLTQHENAADNIRELTNLLLLGGHIGPPNAGFPSVRGHSNMQGDRTMGIAEKTPRPFYAALENEFAVSCPRSPGYNTVDAIEVSVGRTSACRSPVPSTAHA
jgi:formate dehydrogenase major subunit